MNTKKILCLMGIITLLSTGLFYVLKYENDKQIIEEKSGNGITQSTNVVLIIEQYRENELIYRMEKDDDLILRNIAGMFHQMIKGTDIEVSYVYKLTDGGALVVSASTIANSRIRIGTGTTTPAYADWKLETQVYVDEVEALMYSYSGLKMNATFYTTFNIVASYAITEAGLSASISGYDSLVFRDTFSAINVISGDVLTVKYVMMFN